jgi:hypothetical protein
LVALFVMSKERQPMFQTALLSLRWVHFWVTDNCLTVNYATADGGRAQRNALAAAFGETPSYRFRTCFFHTFRS